MSDSKKLRVLKEIRRKNLEKKFIRCSVKRSGSLCVYQ